MLKGLIIKNIVLFFFFWLRNNNIVLKNYHEMILCSYQVQLILVFGQSYKMIKSQNTWWFLKFTLRAFLVIEALNEYY